MDFLGPIGVEHAECLPIALGFKPRKDLLLCSSGELSRDGGNDTLGLLVGLRPPSSIPKSMFLEPLGVVRVWHLRNKADDLFDQRPDGLFSEALGGARSELVYLFFSVFAFGFAVFC